ncbi:hypothetical protein J6590_007203 [Homalodisca vitripennis]|nr:hypothetical protein J6590_007203 [Homalodisca vitripennis]
MARIPVPEVLRFCVDCMTLVGTSKPHAVALAEVLVEADHRGHYSHGINRLGLIENPGIALGGLGKQSPQKTPTCKLNDA